LRTLHPKADAATMEKLRQADLAARQQAAAAAQAMNPSPGDPASSGLDIASRNLPKVSTDPIAPPAEEVAKDTPVFTPAQDNSQAAASSLQNQIASAPTSYGGYGGGAIPPPPPGSMGNGSLVPPPPVVAVSASLNPSGMMPGYDQYASQYMNQYQVPYQQMVPASRPSGSPFGSANGGSSRSPDGDDDRSAAEKKRDSFVPITPTGMEPRSTYKQRDDLKVLWKGAISSSSLQEVMSDGKFADQVRKIDVGLPTESTRGAFNINQPMVDRIFRGGALDRRIVAPVKKAQSDVAHSYYGYLYTYNRFALAEQTLAAQKQEVSVAESPVEKQRAAADVARAQSEVDSARDDMRSAESELASIAGPTAARSIIGKVSGVTPSLESLASASQNDAAAGQRRLVSKMASPVTSLFHFGHGKNEKEVAQKQQPDNKEPVKVSQAKLPPTKKDKNKESRKSKENKREIAGDLSPAPVASSSQSQDNASSDKVASTAHGGAEGISFELKGVNVQPRKSILTVSIRNSGSNSYSFSPELFSISDGTQKLSEAAVRADFDQTMVQPNGEVKGTITIFGRPWNDKLAVVLSDGSKMIQLRR
jgi:hypothetical protein